MQFDESADEERYMMKVLVCHPPPHKKMIQNGTKWLNRSTPTHKKQDTRVYGTEIPVLLIRHRILHIRPVIGFIILSYSSLENLF